MSLTNEQITALLDHPELMVRRVIRKCVENEAGCWVWTRAQTSNGYGSVWVPAVQGTRRAHRVLYELLVAPVPDGLQLDHLCRVRLCCRPSHLEIVTGRENSLRGASPAAANARKTHCLRGHPFEGDNLAFDQAGHRMCRTCRRAQDKRRNIRRNET